MKIVETIAGVGMWPLQGAAGDLFVGGRRLRSWQEEAAPDGGVTLLGNAWVTPADWEHLLESGDEAVLETPAGEILAWTGEGERPADGMVVLASAASCLVSHPWHLLVLNDAFLSALSGHENDERATLEEGARFVVGEGTRILPGVHVRGTVVVGRDCEIGPNCFLRGSTAIADGCHVGQAVEVKNSLIGHGTKAGHLSYIGDSVLGSGVNLGAGTITSNLRHDGKNHRSAVAGQLVDTGRRKFGTVIGDGCHTGIHTAIYPGRKLGPGTATRPGEVVQRDVV